MDLYRIDFRSLPWSIPATGIRAKLFKSGNRQIRLVELSQELIETDWCTRAHYGYILEGELEIDFDGRQEIFKQGDGIFIPVGRNHKHRARALSEKVTMVLVEDV